MASQVNVLTLNEQVADRIRGDIIAGRIRAGQRLNQDLLGERFDVSRTPIREALRILEREGLVAYYPRLGAVVADLSVGDLEELYEIRSIVEPYNAALAVPNVGHEDVRAMERCLGRMGEAEGRREAWFEAHAKFHQRLNVRSGRRRLNALIEGLRQQTERYVRIYQLLSAAGDDLFDQHRRIFEEVRAGKQQGVRRVVREHLELVRDRVIEYLRGEQASGEGGRDQG